MNFEIIEVDNEKYYKVNNQWVDSSFIVAPVSVYRKIIQDELKRTDINALKLEQIEMLINETKKAECYDICLELIEKFLQKALTNNLSKVKFLVSVKCSCLRKLNRPQEAIKFCEEMKKKYNNDILNVAAITSLAAAYCDIENWDYARQVCNYAYKMQGGSVGYNNELSMVYKRIKANDDKK